MKTRDELEAITVQVSKDLCKYNLEFPEMVVILCWILSTIGQRVTNGTHEFKEGSKTIPTSKILEKRDKEVRHGS